MKQLFLWFCGFMISAAAVAQPVCGFDAIHEHHLRTNPDYDKRMKMNDQMIRDFVLKHPELMVAGRTNETVYTIPVVVHVMHTGDTVGSLYNPTDERIIDAVTYMNDLYSGAYSWVGGTGGAKDIGIRFVLAKRDPNCNPTNGIVRVDASQLSGYTQGGIASSSTSTGVPELTVKNLSRWDPSRYYNIWVVNRINGADGTSGQFIAGFAYFPGTSSSLDGTVLLATSIRQDNKVLTHELGHAFNLYHPFQGSSNSTSCPSNGDCLSEGDRVCDTDPVSYNVTNGSVNFSCRTGNNNCNGLPYSENTESNFMGYTNCFTLFTLGQKARMRAAMTLPSRSSLANSTGSIAPDLNPACPPKVNFNIASASLTETKEITSGCIGYKDYTYTISIVSPPSANATVTLTPTGTATQGVDYQLYTQGNLTTPSNTILFPSGSSGNQSFVIRVMDDADVEGAENIVLNYNVSGGGALKGEGIPTFTLNLKDNDVAPQAPNSIVPNTVGNYTGTLGLQGSPLRGEKIKHRIQSIFLASELLAAGIQPGQSIRGLSLFVTAKNSSIPFTGFSVSMGATTLTSLTNGFRGTTTNFTGTLNTVAGENKIDFTNPFVWNGTSNVVIQFCYENASVTSNDVVQAQTSALSGSVATCASDYNAETTEGCALSRVLNFTSRPVIRFYATVTGNPVNTAVTSTQSYLGPNANVYFMNSNGEILARIRNLSAFDYGCTTVEVDRSGSGTAAFWSNDPLYGVTQKTFKVTPQNPNANGNYEISLYYNNAEKAGYESATGLAWSTVQMLKSNGAISGISPSNQQTASVTVNNSATQSAYGSSDHVVTATFSNGFSGFAVGSPGVSTSVNDREILKGVRVYPNPVQKQLYLQLDRSQKYLTLRIMTVEGRILQTEKLNGVMRNHMLNMQSLTKGMYFLEIQTEQGKTVLPLVKQ